MNALKLNVFQTDPKELKEAVLKRVTLKNALITVGVLSAGYAFYRTFRLYLKKRKYRHIPGPPTKGIFGYFTGHAFEIENVNKNGKIMGDLMLKWHETYGDVYKFQLFDKIAVVTSNKNAIKEALVVKVFPKAEFSLDVIGYPLGERLLGNGLVTEPDNEKWKHRRSIFNPGFHRHVLMTFIDHFNQIMNTLSDKLRAKADGKTVVTLMNEMNRATLDAIGLIAFGMNVDSISQKDSILNNCLAKAVEVANKLFVNPLIKYQPSMQAELREFRKSIRYLRKLGRDKIMERLNAYKNNEHIPNDILSSILANYKDGELDIETMTDDFVTFFAAGQETTANTLAFCFLEMGKNPEIARKAREEIDRVLGERTEVTYQDVNELKYCTAIFKETLRLFPAAAEIFRRTTESMHINGLEIPINTSLWISTYVNCRSEKYFKNPLEFNPERFMKGSESEESNYAYLPFGLGPRNCIGKTFAKLEAVIVIAKFLQKFDFKLDPTQSFDIEEHITVRPKDGTRCFLTLRS